MSKTFGDIVFHTPTPLSSSKVRGGSCAWIGASNVNRGREFRWIELPTNYNQLETNGELLTNFSTGNRLHLVKFFLLFKKFSSPELLSSNLVLNGKMYLGTLSKDQKIGVI